MDRSYGAFIRYIRGRCDSVDHPRGGVDIGARCTVVAGTQPAAEPRPAERREACHQQALTCWWRRAPIRALHPSGRDVNEARPPPLDSRGIIILFCFPVGAIAAHN
jgi:hypothetical protein